MLTTSGMSLNQLLTYPAFKEKKKNKAKGVESPRKPRFQFFSQKTVNTLSSSTLSINTSNYGINKFPPLHGGLIPSFITEDELDCLGKTASEEPFKVNPEVPFAKITESLSSTYSTPSLTVITEEITNSINDIKELTLFKNKSGKIGLKIAALHNGIFISLVIKNSPAAEIGLRFGDQILQINGQNLSGADIKVVLDILKSSPSPLNLTVKKRPLQRKIAIRKDEKGNIGFTLKKGKIASVASNSSAAKSGLLTGHNILEVNGLCVLGMTDKQIQNIIQKWGEVFTVTIIPTIIFQNITKRVSANLLKTSMNHTSFSF